MKTPIAITGIATLSPLGINPEEHWKSYQNITSAIREDEELDSFSARLTPEGLAGIE
ncbi:MAG: hypothetical protein ACJARZ_001337, partial [Dokdonia sp.]